MSAVDGIAGEGKIDSVPLMVAPDFKYQAVAGGAESPLFDTREEARAWQLEQREVSGNPRIALELREIEV